MARGWESKDVESQREQAAAERLKAAQAPPVTLEQREMQRKRESLLLSRTRVLHDLENTRNLRYRQTLEASLAHLNKELAKLGEAGQGSSP